MNKFNNNKLMSPL